MSLEALVRLRDDEIGLVPPDEFIPLAERDGSILHIGEQVLEDACQFLAKHVLSNPSMGIRTIQVNVSMVQCLRKNLVETIVPDHSEVPYSAVYDNAGDYREYCGKHAGADAAAYEGTRGYGNQVCHGRLRKR